MDIKNFIKEIKNLNECSWEYGNEVLYKIAKDPSDLKDKDKLEGAIWLIGRAYAASPQRRSYGTTWPVRTQNDGREGFFAEIAETMSKSIKNDALLKKFINCYKIESEYEYNKCDKDIEKLKDSILAVLQFNLILSLALEAFDYVPLNNKFKDKNVYCSNHISFASKFLHFYFPHSVFIIDNFANEGGKSLFNGNSEKNYRTFYKELDMNKDNVADLAFDNKIYEFFKKEDMNKIYKEIINFSDIQVMMEKYKIRSRIDKEDTSTLKNYTEHCIRSYLMGYFLNRNQIKPCNYISSKSPLYSMPRLTDTIFLNIKKIQSESDKTKQKFIKDEYYDQVPDEYINPEYKKLML